MSYNSRISSFEGKEFYFYIALYINSYMGSKLTADLAFDLSTFLTEVYVSITAVPRSYTCWHIAL